MTNHEFDPNGQGMLFQEIHLKQPAPAHGELSRDEYRLVDLGVINAHQARQLGGVATSEETAIPDQWPYKPESAVPKPNYASRASRRKSARPLSSRQKAWDYARKDH